MIKWIVKDGRIVSREFTAEELNCFLWLNQYNDVAAFNSEREAVEYLQEGKVLKSIGLQQKKGF